MKNTLLALMLVSSLFVISCGADATKPKDAYKSQSTETKTGTITRSFTATTGTVDITSSSYLSAGEKVTEIVQVTTSSATGTTTNTVTGITKNTDGGIYKFNISDTTAQSATVTYKYIIKAALPMIEKEITGTYTSGTTLSITINDSDFIFNKTIVSVTDKNGIKYTDYSFNNDNMVTLYGLTGYINGDTFTVRYGYGDITKMSEKPITEATTPPQGLASKSVTIPLDAAANAGKSYYLVATIRQTTSNNLIDYIKENKIVPSTGIITINAPTGGSTSWTQIDDCTYELWVY